MRSEIPHTTSWTLGYDPADPMARVIAERIVLNARDAGLGMQTHEREQRGCADCSGSVDLARPSDRSRRTGCDSLDFHSLKLASNSADDLYDAENRLTANRSASFLCCICVRRMGCLIR